MTAEAAGTAGATAETAGSIGLLELAEVGLIYEMQKREAAYGKTHSGGILGAGATLGAALADPVELPSAFKSLYKSSGGIAAQIGAGVGGIPADLSGVASEIPGLGGLFGSTSSPKRRTSASSDMSGMTFNGAVKIDVTVPGAGNPEKVANSVPKGIDAQMASYAARQSRRSSQGSKN